MCCDEMRKLSDFPSADRTVYGFYEGATHLDLYCFEPRQRSESRELPFSRDSHQQQEATSKSGFKGYESAYQTLF